MMKYERVCVGREAECAQFREILDDPKGQVVLVVGQQGMGKTILLKKFMKMADGRPGLKCGAVRYQVTESQSVDGILSLMMNHAFEAAQKEGSFDRTSKRREQWKNLLNVLSVNIGPVSFGNLGGLVASLGKAPEQHVREQFIHRMELISKKMPDNGRAVFMVDPKELLIEKSDQDWAMIAENLPDKIKLVFAQRPNDRLLNSDSFQRVERECGNVVRIPENKLATLNEQAIDDLIQLRLPTLEMSIGELRKILQRYEGHPYAVDAVIDLVQDGLSLEELPIHPKPNTVADAQWKRICQRGPKAIRLFKALAILEVPVPNEVVLPVADLNEDDLLHLLSDPFLDKLLTDPEEDREIYHSILTNYIVEQISAEEKQAYHARAVEIYRSRLHANEKPDALAAKRLSLHVLESEGEEAFVTAFVNECNNDLFDLGLYDDSIVLSNIALNYASKISSEKANITRNLGLIYLNRGKLDLAEEMHKKSLEINGQLGWLEGMATQYGNLGVVYRTQGKLELAEKMIKQGLDIDEKLGRLEGMANHYGNLGLVYRTQGKLELAEKMIKQGLDIDEKLGRLEGMANQYGNLGLIYFTRKELEQAEEMFKKALDIHERIGRMEGMAIQYGNIGLIYFTQEKLEQAEKMTQKALDIDKQIGRMEGMENHYNNLGAICQKQGKLEQAEEMLKKAFDINKQIGRMETTGNHYSNLGAIYWEQGKLEQAEKMFKKALEIDEQVGRMEGIANQYSNLGWICKDRGQRDQARDLWIKARDLYAKIGIPHKVRKMRIWIDELDVEGRED